MSPRTAIPLTCARCARLAQLRPSARRISTSGARQTSHRAPEQGEPAPAPKDDSAQPRREPGALSRRLEEATEEALLSHSGRRAVDEAGFSPELKERLMAKIAAANPSSPVLSRHVAPGAGEGTRHHAAAQPWTGEEAAEDTALRMLDDAKPRLPRDLRGPAVPPPVTRRRVGGAARAAGARDRAAAYRDTGLSDTERGQLKEEFADRFGSGVRNMPSMMPAVTTGLASMANRR